MSITSTDTGMHLYESLAARIRRSISQGVYEPGALLGSEYGLAREENISRMTVRKAIALLVDEGVLERRPGKGLYVCSDAAKPDLIQVIAGDLQWEPSLQVSRGVQAVAQGRGIQVQLYDAHGDVEMDLKMLRQLPDGPANGAVIVSLHSPAFNEVVCELKLKGYPFVLVDQRLHDIEVSSVTADNYQGGHDIGRNLVQAGHRRVVFIGDLVAMTVRDRLAGLRDAVGEAGLPFPPSWIIDLQVEKDRLGDWSERIDACIRQRMSQADQPTAVVCSCDAVARSVYRTLAGMKLSIPDDVSVVGFDDDPLAEWLTPALTTVHQPFRAMGQAAIELLCERIGDSNAPAEHRVLPVKLIERESVGSPKDM